VAFGGQVTNRVTRASFSTLQIILHASSLLGICFEISADDFVVASISQDDDNETTGENSTGDPALFKSPEANGGKSEC
jgi:hypothetical protein